MKQVRVRRSIRATLPVFALTAASTFVACGGSESDGHAPPADAAGADAVIDGNPHHNKPHDNAADGSSVDGGIKPHASGAGTKDGAPGDGEASGGAPEDAVAIDAHPVDPSEADAGTGSPFDAGTTHVGSTWSAEETFVLNLPAPSLPASYSLDKAGLATLLGTDARTIQVLSLDPSPILSSALSAMKTACGTGWQLDAPNPNYNCAATALGQTFVGTDGTWQTSPDFTTVRWLTTTPANTVVVGTLWQPLTDIANTLPVGGGYQQVLADTFGIARTREIWTTASAIDALRTRFLATHPAMPKNGFLPITVDDVLQDLAPLSSKFGPIAAGHPGLFGPSTSPHSVIAGSTFALNFTLPSNLVTQDGLVLGTGKASLTLLEDTVGPVYDDPVELNLNDPARFSITGLVPAPTADFRFSIGENAAFVKACTATGCTTNLPASPFGTSAVWSTPTWQAENLMAYAASTEFATRAGYDRCYTLCGMEAKVGYSPSPSGWAQWNVAFGLGSPPPDSFLWEGAMELGEVATHRISVNGITSAVAEGSASLAFTAHSVSVAVTADQLRTALRPSLGARGHEIESAAAGDWKSTNANVDLYLHAGLQLWFPTASDPRPSATYPYTHVGFYDDEALTVLASTTDIVGTADTLHQKLALAVGTRTVYAEGGDGSTYRLRITVDASSQVSVAVAKRS